MITFTWCCFGTNISIFQPTGLIKSINTISLTFIIKGKCTDGAAGGSADGVQYMLRKISFVWIKLSNISHKRKLKHFKRPTVTQTVTASRQVNNLKKKLDIVNPNIMSQSVIARL